MSIRMKHEAIKALDSNVYYVIQNGETFVAYDTNDNVVEFDNSKVNTKSRTSNCKRFKESKRRKAKNSQKQIGLSSKKEKKVVRYPTSLIGKHTDKHLEISLIVQHHLMMLHGRRNQNEFN